MWSTSAHVMIVFGELDMRRLGAKAILSVSRRRALLSCFDEMSQHGFFNWWDCAFTASSFFEG